MTEKIINITILKEKEYELRKAFKAVVRAAVKFGLSEPTMELSDIYNKEISVPGETELISEFFQVIDVTINVASLFKLNGDYALFAIVNHESLSHFTIDVEDELPVKYQDVTNMHCEHCNRKIARNKSFILKDSKNAFIKVGKSCMKHFIGLNPESFVSAFDIINEFKTEITGLTPFNFKNVQSQWNTAHSLDLVITLANKLIIEEGYIKKLYDSETDRHGRRVGECWRTNYGKATNDKLEKILFDKDIVLNTSINESICGKIRHYFENLPLTEHVVLKGTKTNPPLDEVFELEHNKVLNDLTGRNKIRLYEAMIIAPAINSYYRGLERQEQLLKDKESVWIGKVGEKAVLRLILEDVKSGEGEYGTWYLWTFKDENGNIFKKFGKLNKSFIVADSLGGKELEEFTEGDIFEFTAEIKEHSVYKEVKTTTLGRLSKAKVVA
jgi:hypothetical protein